MNKRAYKPYEPGRRPGGKPAEAPNYRVLVHRKSLKLWNQLVGRVGIQQAQQFYDYVSTTPGQIPDVGTTTILRGKYGKPIEDGFSRTVHYEITGAGRIDFQFNNGYQTSEGGDPHPVVFIQTINLGSH